VCAGRELIEETGYRAANIRSLGWFYTTPGLTDERMHAFAATGLVHVGQDLEDDETIDVEAVEPARVLGMIGSGEMRDAKSMLAVLLADRAGLLAAGPGRADGGAA
jgi:ADP-ribose pyrophosphatase